MGTIIIGSSANRKGITVNPSVVLFNGSNVKKIMSGLTTVWEDIKALVPNMTSNTTPYGEVSASSSLYDQPSNYAPWKAFVQGSDKNDENSWLSKTSSNEWIQYKFTSPTCVRKFSITNRTKGGQNSQTPTSMILKGSNDGVNFETLGSFTNEKTGYKEQSFYNVDNKNYYLYYRLVCSCNLGGDVYMAIHTLQFYGTQLVGLVPTMTSNTTPSGVASASFETDNYAPWKAFNGTTSGSDDAWIAMGTSSAWIQYQFTNPTIANKVSITNRNYENTCAIKNFTVQGSNDNSAWTDLGSFVKSDGANNFELFSFNNNTAYLYYRISIKDIYGTDAGIGELQFYK